MEIHYNAFISYKHHPDDIRVASQIHRSLECYKIPKAIRKKYGSITRCFRDKEELPIGSDLSSDIETALKNSDYLIVICSVHTKESLWVQREIEMFLKSHDRSKILTVLCNGEPYDVIPEILLYNEKTNPITGEVTRIPLEPLSCDWRLPRRKAKSEELPRLVATLLGCSYDELRQRKKQYQTRRLITAISIAFSISLCLAVYFLYTTLAIRNANIRIQENLDVALKNQSLHLATAAKERLAEGDRLTAVSLAMAALPTQENPRPYVAEAEQILTNALQVYSTSDKDVAVGIMDVSSAVVNQFWVTKSEDLVYMYDKRGVLSSWNTDTIQNVGQVQLADINLNKLLITEQENAVVLDKYNHCLYCFTPEGSCLWQLENCSDAAILLDGHTVLAITSDNTLVFLDASNGKPIRTPLTLSLSQEGIDYYSFLMDTYQDEQLIPLIHTNNFKDDLISVNSESGMITVLAVDIQNISCSYQTTAGKLFTMSSDGKSTDGSFWMAGILGENRITQPGSFKIFCYDLTHGSTEWESEITVCTYTSYHTLEAIPQSNQLLCQTGNVFQIINMQTGQLISRCETGSNIIDVKVGETNAIAVLQDGFFDVYDYESNTCYEYKRAQGNLAQAYIGNVYFTLPQYSTYVIIYNTLEGNPLWTWTSEGNESRYIKAQQVYGDFLAYSDNYLVSLFDIKKQELYWQTDSSTELLGFTTDGTELWTAERDEVTILDIYGNTTAVFELPPDPENEYSLLTGSAHMSQDQLYYPVKSDNTLKLLRWAPNNATPTIVAVFDIDITSIDVTIVACHDDYMWIYLSNGQLYEVNVVSGAIRILAEGLTRQPNFAFRDKDDLFAVTINNEIWTCYPDNKIHCQIPLTDTQAGALCFYGEELLALCDDCAVYRFGSAGELLSRTIIDIYDSFTQNLINGDGSVEWYFTEDNKLILNACRMGNVIDCDSWKCCTVIPNFVIYRQDNNSFICTTDQGMAAYPRYTIDNLLDIGKEQLKGYELTKEQRISYGID